MNERKAREQTDINYLKFENENSLAARLARPTIDITLARQQADQKPGKLDEQAVRKYADEAAQASPVMDKPIQFATSRGVYTVDELLGIADSQREASANTRTPNIAPARTYSDSQNMEIMEARRREARFVREALHQSLKEKQKKEMVEREKRQEERQLNKMAKAHAAIQEFKPFEEQIESPARPSNAGLAERAATIRTKATESARKRMEERLKRERNVSTFPHNRRQDRPTSRTNQRQQESFEIEFLDESLESNNGPEFKGPEPVSTNLFETFQPAVQAYKAVADLQAGRIHGGDYSAYVPRSLASFATPPLELGAARLAELALSHRRDVSLPSRKHTVHLIASALKPKQVQKST